LKGDPTIFIELAIIDKDLYVKQNLKKRFTLKANLTDNLTALLQGRRSPISECLLKPLYGSAEIRESRGKKNLCSLPRGRCLDEQTRLRNSLTSPASSAFGSSS